MVVNIIWRTVESNHDEVFIEKNGRTYAFLKRVNALETTAEINPEDYVLIQERNQASSAMSMKQGYNGSSQRDTIVEVLKAGLTMPRASRFVKHLLNVDMAKNGKGVLYRASGDLVEGKGLDTYWNTMFHNHRIWAPESFRKGEGHLGLDVVTLSGLDESGEPVYNTEPLEQCLERDCYANLDSVNSQGFLTEKSITQEYVPGKNIYFFHPRKDRAVRFDAYPDYADFDCFGDPQNSDSGLGGFACAEGAVAENLGDKE